MSTPFDSESLDMLVRDIGVRTLKFGSGDLTNGPLLLHAARTGLPMIVSTGMSTLAEVEMALGVLAHGYMKPKVEPTRSTDFLDMLQSPEAWEHLRTHITLLHCTTEYPAPCDGV
ncbi:MAG: N-acetylneuraminate synthase family protein, partial [Hyphomicrobium sp.]